MAVFFARMVMPRSRSNSFESITRSTWCSLERKVPLCCSMASTSVVLPWSTCAMMAMLRILELKVELSLSKMPRGDPRRPYLLLYYGGLKVESLRSRIVSDAKKILNRRGRREHPQKIAEISCYPQAQILLAGHSKQTIKQKAKRPILPDRSAPLVQRADARLPAQPAGRR